MRRELIERFTLERVSASPAQFDYAKLDWMNGVYLRELSPQEYAHRLLIWLGENGYDWDAELVTHAAPLVQEKIARLAEFPGFAGFLFGDVEPNPADLEGGGPMLAAAYEALAVLEPFEAEAIEKALRAAADGLGLKPRQAFQPVRVAVTGSKVSPGLFESIELLGRETTLSRLRAAAPPPRRSLAGNGRGGASGSSARWKASHDRCRNRLVGWGKPAGSALWTPRPPRSGSETALPFQS